MTAGPSIDLSGWLDEQLAQASPDLLRGMIKTFAEALMGAEADAICGAPYGERSAERTNKRNGYRDRDWDTRAGSIELAIPKLRSGSYFPGWLLERQRRAEAALVSVVATCYLLGVSTRRMDRLVHTLGITSLSKSQVSEMAKSLDGQVQAFRTRPLDAGPYTFVAADALVLKVREGGRTVNVHALLATGVNAEGYREILGVHVTSAEDGAGWLGFFRDLTARGLTGVRLVTSDAHRGLVDAIGATLPAAAWQRCRTHYAANLMSATPKAQWGWVKALLHSVYDQPDADAVHAQFDRIVDALTDKLPAVAAHLDTARADILAFTAFPKAIWRQIWSNNPQVIWSWNPGVHDVHDGAVRSRDLRAGRGYLPLSSTRVSGRFHVRSAGGDAVLAARVVDGDRPGRGADRTGRALPGLFDRCGALTEHGEGVCP
jgi:putative transposase